MPLFGKKKEGQQAVAKPAVRKFVPREPQVERLVWLGLKAADVMAQSLFLEDILQLRFADEGNSGAGHHIRYNCGWVELELVEGGMTWVSRPRPKNGSPDTPLVASFVIDNINQAVEELNTKEVPVTQVFDQDWTASALFFDPERNIWQLEELRTAPPIGTTQLERIGTIWLECENYEQQVAFYRDILKLPLVAVGGGARPVTRHTEMERRHLIPETETQLSQTFEIEKPEATAESQAVPESASSETMPDEGAEEKAAPLDTQTTNFSSYPVSEDIAELPLNTPEQLEASLVGENPPAAVFFNEPAHLVLVPGGRKPEGVKTRVWGRDVNFTLSFQSYDVKGLALKLREAGYTVTAPVPDPDLRRGLAFNFSDPEGNVWQVAEWPRLPA